MEAATHDPGHSRREVETMTTDLDAGGREPPVSRRIADDLRRKIEAGELAAGNPYELTRFVMRGDLTGLVYDIPVE